MLDFRRHFRPFFLTPDGSAPTPYKRYYDFAGWLTTQLAMSFAAAPFVLLDFSASMTAWAHVYYYGIIGVVVSLSFFASPGKKWLVRKLKARNEAHKGSPVRAADGASAVLLREGEKKMKQSAEERKREQESDSMHEMDVAAPPMLGLPEDLEREFDDALREIKTEIESRRRKGSTVTMPSGQELRTMIEDRLKRKF